MSDVLDILEGPALDREARRMRSVLRRAARVVRSETGGFLMQAETEAEFAARCDYAAQVIDRVAGFELPQFIHGRQFLTAALRRDWRKEREGGDEGFVLPLRQATPSAVTVQAGDDLYVLTEDSGGVAVFPASSEGQISTWRPLAEAATVDEAIRAVEATPKRAATRSIDEAYAEIKDWSYDALRGALRRVSPDLLGEYPKDESNRELLIEELLGWEFGSEAEGFHPKAKVAEAPLEPAENWQPTIPGVDWAAIQTMSARQYRSWLLSWVEAGIQEGTRNDRHAEALARHLAEMTDVPTPVVLAELEREASVRLARSDAITEAGWDQLAPGDWVFIAGEADPIRGLVEAIGEIDGQVVASVRDEQCGELYECSPVYGHGVQRRLDGEAFTSARECATYPDRSDHELVAICRSFEGCALESLPHSFVESYRAASKELDKRRISLPLGTARLALEAEADPDYEAFSQGWIEVSNSRGLCACGQSATHKVWAPVASTTRSDLVCVAHRAGAVAKYVPVAAPLFPLVERSAGESLV
jgi:hypothetical protein